ncbi:hypothetical protein PHYBLDRAFT_181285 [Phycomyces blakesleeanus NRRL 1555(-)]|uniref:Glutathione synthetase n=1 Tax=Phycomyces blakesleeanus (strain ATCC 8743b / DSM 1359 / FGSC 10004 / NBRC 33097 / NRRL 1555) TaxID=763407 RepID=A0A162U5I4_PHYB8|nr:hypothetical protein PHYBLDRAFT_181285 [Phycomyces blakesleeanus NRRL 1555(-)]OAD73602.1 hypothetical protein PHYBLDRAFT_181285 [Phycomyces blakesleeanus NRRL 1555(-)]|eukprot:XP_018291642.1 hypothetical protein PHYBLDRAFT_181285 [Phycomyces blakesleeanus NRRL 1555(-)]
MAYPPKVSAIELEELRISAIDWALAHGLIVRPTVSNQNLFASTSVVNHAPFALYPSSFPRAEFEKAKGLQQPWNTLIHKMSQDDSLITEVMETLSKVDEFMSQLYKVYLTVKNEGFAQTASLGIHRCDYLLHSDDGNDIRNAHIQQVEFNTISSSFGSLSTRTCELHRYLLGSLDSYAGGQIKLNQLPENNAIEGFANGLASAWEHYGKPDAYILMVTQPGERNVFDQRWIEYSLVDKHGIHLMRRTLAEIEQRAIINPTTKTLTMDGHEIAVTYFRAGYGPEDYPTQKEWDARLKLERSLSIKCPTAAYQIVGGKKVQQVLTVPGRLERYVDVYTADLLRESFAGLYPLDASPEGINAYKSALAHPDRYVLKPQREGGGHNFYGQDVVNELKKLSVEERNAYILMSLIKTPPSKNLMVREGEIIEGDVASELGIYGIYLSDGDKVLVNEVGGHLLRTKGHSTNEGGVAAGFAVIDSPLLV